MKEFGTLIAYTMKIERNITTHRTNRNRVNAFIIPNSVFIIALKKEGVLFW